MAKDVILNAVILTNLYFIKNDEKPKQIYQTADFVLHRYITNTTILVFQQKKLEKGISWTASRAIVKNKITSKINIKDVSNTSDPVGVQQTSFRIIFLPRVRAWTSRS